ncbi:MAG: protein phosphatase 2C domain-containing protein [Treponema sp.]|nr:protein phosphatase 2C domain-containing protein [Treponema sp.]
MKDYRSFAVHVIGGSHIKNGVVCQDYSGFYEDNDVRITVVADGHGDSTCFRSDMGSKFAVDCTLDGIKKFINFIEKYHDKGIGKSQVKLFGPGVYPARKKFDSLLRENLIRCIVASWNIMVLDHFKKNPFTEDELESIDTEKYRLRFEEAQKEFNETGSAGEIISKAYGATLIAAAMSRDYWFGFHIGDGRFTVLYKNGTGEQPVPWDEKCYLNVTTSLSDNDILDRENGVRSYFSFNAEKEAPIAIYLCTDGIDDNYPVDEDENKKQLTRLYRTISLAYADDGYESTCRQLKDLADNFAIKGKGDDTSVGLIINIPELQKVKETWKENIEKAEKEREKKKAEEAEKARKERTAFEKKEEIKKAVAAARVHEIAAEKAEKEAESAYKAVIKAKKDFDTAWKTKKEAQCKKAVGDAVSKNKQAEIAEDNASDAAIAAREAAEEAAKIAQSIEAENLENTSEAQAIRNAASDASACEKKAAVSAQKAREYYEKASETVRAIVKIIDDAKETKEAREAKEAVQDGSDNKPEDAEGTKSGEVVSADSLQKINDAIYNKNKEWNKTELDHKRASNAYNDNKK